MFTRSAVLTLIACATPGTPAQAAEISTHVFNLARGVGGDDVPVTPSRRLDDGRWVEVAGGRTDGNGRVRSVGDPARFEPGVYRLHFDISAYPRADAVRFFPEIDVAVRVTDASGHYHVPVVVSSFGYAPSGIRQGPTALAANVAARTGTRI